MEITHLTQDITLLDAIIAALAAAGRIPKARPAALAHQPHMHRDNIDDFVIEMSKRGYIANIYFREVPKGQPAMAGTPECEAYPTAEMALSAGARILCEIISGSDTLPFPFTEASLLAAAQTTCPSPWRRPRDVGL